MEFDSSNSNEALSEVIFSAILDDLKCGMSRTFYITLFEHSVSCGLKSSKKYRGRKNDIFRFIRNFPPPSLNVKPLSVSKGYHRDGMSDNFYGEVSVGRTEPPRFPVHRENISSVPIHHGNMSLPFESVRDASRVGEISCQAMELPSCDQMPRVHNLDEMLQLDISEHVIAELDDPYVDRAKEVERVISADLDYTIESLETQHDDSSEERFKYLSDRWDSKILDRRQKEEISELQDTKINLHMGKVKKTLKMLEV